MSLNDLRRYSKEELMLMVIIREQIIKALETPVVKDGGRKQ